MIDNINEFASELDKTYYSYIRSIYSLLNYSLNTSIEKELTEVKANLK
jgi:hypothetical protein